MPFGKEEHKANKRAFNLQKIEDLLGYKPSKVWITGLAVRETFAATTSKFILPLYSHF